MFASRTEEGREVRNEGKSESRDQLFRGRGRRWLIVAVLSLIYIGRAPRNMAYPLRMWGERGICTGRVVRRLRKCDFRGGH